MKLNGNYEHQAELFAALAAAQGAFPPIERNKTVKVTMKSGGTYTFDYADLDEILSKTRKPLAANGLALLQAISERDIAGKEGELASAVGVLTTVLAHKSGATLETEQTFSLGGTNQEMGADITYKRRYAVSAILNIAAETDDDGGTGDRSKAASRELSDRQTNRQRQREIHPTDATPDEVDTILKFKEARNVAELTGIFNGLPADARRPGTNLFKAFSARRDELASSKG